MSGDRASARAVRAPGGAHKQAPPARGAVDWGPLLHLFWLSIFLFYLEMTAIRFVSTEIRIFAYFKNLALVACFFGMGVGCLTARRTRWPFSTTFPLVTGLVLAVLVPKRLGFDPYAQITKFLGAFNEMAVWDIKQGAGLSLARGSIALVLLTLLVAWIALLFLPGGRRLADLMGRCPNRIAAYSANVAGSLVGIWLFTATSAFSLPPLIWMCVLFSLGLALCRGRKSVLVVAVSAAALLAAHIGLPAERGVVKWSPYQKLSTRPLTIPAPNGVPINVGTLMQVNETFYQRIVNLSPGYVAQHMNLWPEATDLDYMSYNTAYRVRPHPRNVLIVGAGTGNDVAAALRNGAGHVDAVEIDPVIVQVGRSLHPERPYDDARVTVHVDDARSFFKKTKAKYDLIVFGALDSHTLSSTLSNVQIDNYVYTVEAFREARSLLANDGVLCVVFAVGRSFVGFRIYEMLKQAFGAPPLVFQNREISMLAGAGGGPTFFSDKDGRVARALREDPKLAEIARVQAISVTRTVEPGTDDWPYLYLEGKKIPVLHRIVMGILLLLGLLTVRPLIGGVRKVDFFFFLTGAAFLLVEVQAISRLALLFGTTWFVNSVGISAVLVMILLANLIVERIRIRTLSLVYLLLAASVVLNLVFPFSSLLRLSMISKALVAGAVMGLPVLFAGVIFARVFAHSADAGLALGSNLFGALVGGCCESLSFVTGINALGFLVLAFYLGSFVLLRRRGGG